jgi:hypothetical protein
MKKIDIREMIKDIRLLEKYHDGNDPINIPIRSATALCDAVEGAIPALDLLQTRLEQGANISESDGVWWLFDKGGEGIVGGKTLLEMINNLGHVEIT